MFYSETLLSKTGPLARVWLAANLERKLSKSNILQSSIEDSVGAIVDQGQAPMALRLSGQLLLGVVRIYSRKARYLLDDCNEALMKIKMAFRPGAVDLPTTASHAVDPATLVMPDILTELDLLQPLPDPALLLAGLPEISPSRRDPTLLDFDTSQLISGSIEEPRAAPEELQLFEDDLPLDIGEEISIEIGRREAPARPLEEEYGMSPKPFGADELMLGIEEAPEISALPEDTLMGGMEELGARLEEEEAPVTAAPEERRERETISPLTEIRPSVERDLEQTYLEQTAIAEAEEEAVRQAQRAKRRRVLPADADTEIHHSQIREQQTNRDRILKPASFLPRDPMLLALMNMQRTGGFVSSILGDGRSQGWAPELRGILSLEVVRRSGDLKRKRDEGLPEIEAVEEEARVSPERVPELEIRPEEVELGPAPIEELEEEELEAALSPPPYIEEYEAPEAAGPVAVATRHAVHMLRGKFGPEPAESPEERERQSILFQELLPEATTTRADATKMFFEILVLSTKDAVALEQPADVLGGPLRIKAKRGLWGDWAEASAGGEIASQTQPTASPVAVA
ncbi:sister chromatid cohesion protein 1 [Coniosporium tulheliwenetii]|uniref:Sister chromatid cohesion protein 1 n=1 Tax=Coniosporium tulheliwenetii TaxID=3383036 RepID=A0ACC2ZMT9_9PEZI|nr:sister chromatid cohesion protein 1 [Cladosporium sp. JES 115]